MTNLDNILKNRDITLLADKVHMVKAMVFLVVMYRYESWALWIIKLDQLHMTAGPC